jgi:hypothetical protein
MGPYNRKLELTGRVFARSHAAIARALERGKFLTRSEIAEALSRVRIQAHGQRLAHLVMQAELDQLICSGPMRGKKFTYALLEERVPRAKTLTRDEALAELVRRYFSSHGPATLRDFAWWSGLTVADAKRGTELISGDLITEVIDGCSYWSSATSSPRGHRPPARTNHIRSVFLLPTYDEYLIAYRDRDLIAVPAAERTHESAFDLFANFLFVDGRLAGTWRRTVSKDSIVVSVTPHIPLSPADTRLLNAEAERLGQFLDSPVTLTVGAH